MNGIILCVTRNAKHMYAAQSCRRDLLIAVLYELNGLNWDKDIVDVLIPPTTTSVRHWVWYSKVSSGRGVKGLVYIRLCLLKPSHWRLMSQVSLKKSGLDGRQIVPCTLTLSQPTAGVHVLSKGLIWHHELWLHCRHKKSVSLLTDCSCQYNLPNLARSRNNTEYRTCEINQQGEGKCISLQWRLGGWGPFSHKS